MGILLPKSYTLFLLRSEILVYEYGLSLGKGGTGLKSGKSYPLSSASIEDVLEKIGRDYKVSSEDSLYFGLPLRYFTAINFELPVAAKKNLDQAVKYSLMRHIPYDLEEAHWHYSYEEKGQSLHVSATLAMKNSIEPVLSQVASAGLVTSLAFPSLVFIAGAHAKDGVYVSIRNAEGEVVAVKRRQIVFQASDNWTDPSGMKSFLASVKASLGNMAGIQEWDVHLWRSEPGCEEVASLMDMEPERVIDISPEVQSVKSVLDRLDYKLDFVPSSVVRSKKISFYMQCGAAVLLLLSLLCLPGAKLLGKAARLEKLESKIESMEGTAKKVSSIRNENSKLREEVNKIGEYVHDQPYVTELLTEITEVLPKDTWLTSLSYSNGRVVLSGNAPSASATLEALENSPLFKEAAFDSQITKVGSDELFKIVLRLER